MTFNYAPFVSPEYFAAIKALNAATKRCEEARGTISWLAFLHAQEEARRLVDTLRSKEEC